MCFWAPGRRKRIFEVQSNGPSGEGATPAALQGHPASAGGACGGAEANLQLEGPAT